MLTLASVHHRRRADAGGAGCHRIGAGWGHHCCPDGGSGRYRRRVGQSM